MSDLYQQQLMSHFRSPKGAVVFSDEDEVVVKRNPTCGDEIRLQVVLENGKFVEVKHEVSGCSICVASASLMTEWLEGLDVVRGREGGKQLAAFFSESGPLPDKALEPLQAIVPFPMRHGCALLPWEALAAALD